MDLQPCSLHRQNFTSCSNEDELGAQSPDGLTPITLTSNIATRTVNTELQETEIAQGVQVGVFVAPTEAGEPDSRQRPDNV